MLKLRELMEGKKVPSTLPNEWNVNIQGDIFLKSPWWASVMHSGVSACGDAAFRGQIHHCRDETGDVFLRRTEVREKSAASLLFFFFCSPKAFWGQRWGSELLPDQNHFSLTQNQHADNNIVSGWLFFFNKKIFVYIYSRLSSQLNFTWPIYKPVLCGFLL